MCERAWHALSSWHTVHKIFFINTSNNSPFSLWPEAQATSEKLVELLAHSAAESTSPMHLTCEFEIWNRLHICLPPRLELSPPNSDEQSPNYPVPWWWYSAVCICDKFDCCFIYLICLLYTYKRYIKSHVYIRYITITCWSIYPHHLVLSPTLTKKIVII
jgi:hypothetical protein